MKGVIVHALLALFGLVFAFQTYTRKPEEETVPGGVTVVECSRDQITKVALETATTEVIAEPVREGKDTVFWVTTRHRPPDEVVALDPSKNPRHFPPDLSTKAKAADKSAAAGSGAVPAHTGSNESDGSAESDGSEQTEDESKKEVAEANKPKRFLANTTFAGYLKRLTPVRALRSLGKLEGKQDADFGFGKTLTFLELECGGHTLELQSGTRAFGSSQRYLRDTKTGVTYLFDEPTISDLESAQFKFMQADLHAWKPEEIEEATVEAPSLQGAKKKLVHRDRKQPQAQWVDEAAQDKRNELYNNWFSRLSRLRARAYLDRAAEPGSDLKAPGSATAVLRIDYKVAESNPGKLELVRVDENGVGHYYARTETTRTWVSLFDSAAKDVEQDVGMVVGVEQPAEGQADGQKKGAKPEGARRPAPAHGGKSPEEFLPAGHPRVPPGH